MADNRKIVIELKNVEGESAASKTNKTAEQNSNELQKTLKSLFHPIKTFESETIAKNVIVNQAVQLALNTAKTAGTYVVNKYFALSEDYLAETDFNNAMTGIKKVASFGTAIGAGAIAGAAAGPVGAVVGGLIGAVGWGVSQGFQTANNKLQQQIMINTNNYQSQFQQTRLGLTEGRGVTNQ